MKLISLNIEGNKHFDKIFPLVEREQPDVLCFQEVFEQDVPLLEKTFGMTSHFAPQSNINVANPHMPTRGVLGVAQFTHLKQLEKEIEYYSGSAEKTPLFFDESNENAQNRIVVWQKVEKAGAPFVVGTTHFTWSPEGSFTAEQKSDFEALRNILGGFDEFIFCGDFNSPRNKEPDNVYNSLAKMYQDVIPPEYETSIDASLHKSGKQIMLMVDGLFLSPHYQAANVKLVDRVSDHMAIVAEISRR